MKRCFPLIVVLILLLTGCGGSQQSSPLGMLRCPPDMLMGPPAWSPDGSQIAFVRSSSPSSTYTSIANPETGIVLDIPNTSDGYMVPSWMADGSGLIVYFEAPSSVNELHHVDISTLAETTILTAGSQEHPTDFSASPDGEHLLVSLQRSTGSVLKVMDMDGQNARIISGDLPRPMLPTWSPDGTQIAFFNSIGGVGDLLIVDVDSAEIITLLEGITTGSNPLWSPDGSKIAFLANDAVQRLHDLVVVDVESGDVTLLTQDVIQPFVWEPDGSAIRYMTDQGDVMRISLDGSDPEVVLPEVFDARVDGSFSPDGTMIAYIADQGGLAELFTVEIASGTVTQITHNPGNQWCLK